MVQNPPESLEADFALSDVRVAIHSRPQRCLRIVDVQHKDATQAHGALNDFERPLQTCFTADVVPCFKHMSRVQARSQW